MISGWPFQKDVAAAMDRVMVNMVAMIIPVPKADGECWVGWLRRKRGLARGVCSDIGFWSLEWAKQVVSWNTHLKHKKGVFGALLEFRGDVWLRNRRRNFVSASGISAGRCSEIAGRTGCRLNIGGPTPRWDASVKYAQATIDSQSADQIRNSALSENSRIRRAISAVSQFFSGRPPES